MKDPLGVSPSKGIKEPQEVKKNSFDLGGNRTHDLRIRSTVTLPTELRGRTEKVGDDLGGEPHRGLGRRLGHRVSHRHSKLGFLNPIVVSKI